MPLKNGGQEPPFGEHQRPRWIRLPKTGMRCPYSGLSRSKLNQLVLATEANDYRPLVRSKSCNQPGKIRGVRLIDYISLMDYLDSL